MSTIGDIVNGNPFYDKGVFLDSSYYRTHIPQNTWNNPAPSSSLIKKSLIEQSCLTIASQALLIGCVFVPSVYLLGMVTALPAMGSAVLCALMTHDIDDQRGDSLSTGIFVGTKFKAALLAALPKEEHYKCLLREGGWDAAIKTAFLGLITLTPLRAGTVFSHIGIFWVTYHFTRELEQLILLCVQRYAQQAVARHGQQLNAAVAPAPAQ